MSEKGRNESLPNSEAGDKLAPSNASTSSLNQDTARHTNMDVEAQKKDGIAPDLSNYVVAFEENDPENPHNWTLRKKVLVTIVLNTLPLIVNVGTSILGQGSHQIAQEFAVSSEVTIFTTTCFLLGFTFGPLIFGPLSEKFGRKIPIISGVVLFATFCLPVALAQNVYTIFICRFFSGVFGSASMSVTGGTLADIWSTPVTRGISLDIFISTGFLGPVFGPIIGSFIVASHLRWRWTMWITAIGSYSFSILAFFTIPETYAPLLLERKASRKRAETKEWAWHAKTELNPGDLRDFATRYLTRPFYLLATEPILILMTIYMSFIYGLLFIFFGAFPISFSQDRGWSLQIASLPFIGMLVGIFLGIAIVLYVTLTTFAKEVREGRVIPESRLPLMIFGAVLLPAGLFWFAWTSHPGTSWVAQVISTAPIAAAMFIIFIQGLKYIVDAYLLWANSAISANTAVRSFFGAGFPLFTPAFMHNLGVDWAVSTLAFIAVALIPVPVIFVMYGKQIRGWSKNVMNNS